MIIQSMMDVLFFFLYLILVVCQKGHFGDHIGWLHVEDCQLFCHKVKHISSIS